MCNCTSGNLEIPGLRFAHPGMTVSIVHLILGSERIAGNTDLILRSLQSKRLEG
jgi:hypothetical protein